jgi:hypothetical protein
MAEDIDLNSLPVKEGPKDGGEAQCQKSSPQDQYRYLFVDYDLLHKDPKNGDRFWGNWRSTAAQACLDKKIDTYVDRSSMRGYGFAQPCPPSRNGIWQFWLA